MAEVTTYRCDVCGTLKREANNWYIAARVPGPRFTIITFEQSLRDPNAEPLHLCGLGCAVKAMQEAMEDK